MCSDSNYGYLINSNHTSFTVLSKTCQKLSVDMVSLTNYLWVNYWRGVY